ncbi:MAG: DUF2812 domain-containing protein [Chloroflexi bacterium]|nr:DUF2812 domain-containing protein [Chloroflexota bacterium]
MTTLKLFRWFWAWDDEKEEAWLRGMAQKGWHFKSVSLPGNYTFEQGEPGDFVYRLDYFTEKKDILNYLQIFQDAGWEYMGEMNGWQYFRKHAVAGEELDIYSDNESKAKKYQRILFILVAILPILMINVINLNKMTDSFAQALTFFFFVFLIFYSYAIVKLGLRVTALKRKL